MSSFVRRADLHKIMRGESMIRGDHLKLNLKTVVNLLNLGILAGSVAVKLPQIIKIVAVC